MRIEDLATPGIIPSGQRLRGESVKAINYLAVVSTYTGSTSHADQLATFFSACATEAGKYVRVTGVTVAPATSSGAVGSTVQLTATIAPAYATGKQVTWTSANTAVATVDASGLVTRVALGTVVVTATSQDDATLTGTSTITVA